MLGGLQRVRVEFREREVDSDFGGVEDSESGAVLQVVSERKGVRRGFEREEVWVFVLVVEL